MPNALSARPGSFWLSRNFTRANKNVKSTLFYMFPVVTPGKNYENFVDRSPVLLSHRAVLRKITIIIRVVKFIEIAYFRLSLVFITSRAHHVFRKLIWVVFYSIMFPVVVFFQNIKIFFRTTVIDLMLEIMKKRCFFNMVKFSSRQQRGFNLYLISL